MIFKFKKNGVFFEVLYPFLMSRFLLVIVGFLALIFPKNLNYPVAPEILKRGWQFFPLRIFDIFGRWDSAAYLRIIKYGYYFHGDINAIDNVISYGPLYPLTVKFLSALFFGFADEKIIFLVGVILSNLLFVFALFLLYKLVYNIFGDRQLAKNSLWLILLFPTSFFFSAFYSESMYLFFAVSFFYFGLNKKWFLCGLMGFLMALTRPIGLLSFLVFLVLYLENIKFKFKNFKLDFFWIFLIPAGFIIFLIPGYFLSGDFFLSARKYFNFMRFPWETFLRPYHLMPFLTDLERFFTIFFVFLSFLTFFIFGSLSFGIFSLFSVLVTLFSGTLLSSLRYYQVLFPAFITLAKFCKNRILFFLVVFIFIVLQVILMVLWSQFYWVA